MKILWIVNTIIPEIGDRAGITAGIGGGWLSGISKSLIQDDRNELTICFPYNSTLVEGTAGNLRYYSFHTKGFYKYSDETELRLTQIIRKEQPALVHIFGTEFPHALAAINAAEKCGVLERTVISIQGLVSVYANHYFAGLKTAAVHSYTLRDFLRRDNIFRQAQKYAKRGEFEIAALKKIKHVIGRTDWDEACVKSLNPGLYYHFSNETLREDFYSGKWEYDLCEKHTIFVGSSSYPIKGLHCVLEVFPKILNEFPDTKLYVTGKSPLIKNGIQDIVHRTFYQEYLERMIRKLNLERKICFLGNLSASEMKKRMLMSNVYILPSSIENSPNTLCEAMILGVPCIAADVGGVKNLAIDKTEAYVYPFEENYMIPFYVSKVFNDIDSTNRMSLSARSHASITHDKKKNNETLLKIYAELVNE